MTEGKDGREESLVADGADGYEYDEGENNLDSDEFLTAFKIPFDKALEMCNNGEIIDSKTIIGINLYNNLVRKNKRG